MREIQQVRERPLEAKLLEAKFLALDLKNVDQSGHFAGYASLFEREDLGRDVIAPAAFSETLKKRGTRGVKLLFQHDPNQPIGVWTRLKEDARGLYAEGRLMEEVARAREVASLMRAGALDGLSIGFRALKARRDPRTGIRRIEKLDLWEISVVTFPMLPEARISRIKSGLPQGRDPTEREFERWLTRDAGLTRSQARALLRDGFRGFRSLRDAGGANRRGGSLADRISEAARRIEQS
jgi:HK97 family phage prohead protease